MFGINGFVMGPLVAALFMAFWGIFIREFSEEAHRPPASVDDGVQEPGGEAGNDVR
jgi:predicted PurR-regulated permease PerM